MENIEKLKVLTGDEVSKIHETSILILEKTGVHVNSSRVLKSAGEMGLVVDLSKKIVKFPKKIVENCLKSAPKAIDLYSAGGLVAAELGKGNSYTANGHNAIFVKDYGMEDRRNATKEDIGRFALLADNLKNFDIVSPEAYPQDVKPEASLLHAVDAIYNNTQKHLYVSPERAEELVPIYEIVKVVSDSPDLSHNPPVTCQLSSTPPLSWEKGQIEALFETVSRGVPLSLLPQPYTGVTSPYTLAGYIAVYNAELLSGVVFSQLINPGTPVIYGSAWSTFDMKTANVLIAAPETVLMRLAGSQLAELYSMPYHVIAPDSDAHTMDEQLSWEKCATAWGAYLAGADLIVNGGMFGTGLMVSFEQLVLDDELFSYIKRIAQGIRVDDDTLALDIIEKLGPKGNYLMDEHTLKYLGSGEHWEPDISVREQYENWRKKGKKDIVRRAHEKVLSILGKKRPAGLPREKTKEIKKIIEKFVSSI
ncbi:MAG TPA: hypothetical protein ENI15_00885 [Spirochaetes bacterium]|nr:hypothetical protein [Spirochaetota bacterium]